MTEEGAKLLELFKLEEEYRKKFLGENDIVNNGIHVNDEQVFPRRWFSDYSIELRTKLVSLSLEKEVLIKDLDEYIEYNHNMSEIRLAENVEQNARSKR